MQEIINHPISRSGKSVVGILRTSAQNVVDDIGRLMRNLNYKSDLTPKLETILKINISWHHYYPACSTTPWQLEGVTRTLIEDHFIPESLIPAQNRTVVVDPEKGAENNRHNSVLNKYGLKTAWLFKPEVEWVNFKPQQKMLVLDDIFPEGITIPKLFIGKNAIHLPTMKTHVFTRTTGAMKNAFGGLLKENRHWCHAHIHETLVDLLAIQKEIHPGLFAVMDGTISGKGPGPRAMEPVVTNLMLASNDMVSIDAIAAKLMGFEPLEIDYIRLAHDMGLGCGDPREIELIGDDVGDLQLNFKVGNTLASLGQKMIYWGPLKPFEKFLLRSKGVGWSYIASKLYHDFYWYPLIGKRRKNKILNGTDWGNLFKSY